MVYTSSTVDSMVYTGIENVYLKQQWRHCGNNNL